MATYRLVKTGLAALGLILAATAASAAKPEGSGVHFLRGAEQAKSPADLKPTAHRVALPQVWVETAAHYHEDGGVRYACTTDHGDHEGAGEIHEVEVPSTREPRQ